jgi:hypothetical protein
LFSESFFATSAQVLAALLIAFILELRSIIKIIVSRMVDEGFTTDTEVPPEAESSPEKKRELTNWELLRADSSGVTKWTSVIIGGLVVLFVLGESISLIALQLSPQTRHNDIVVNVCTLLVLLADLAILLVVVTLPIMRIYLEVGDQLAKPVKWIEKEDPARSGKDRE